MRISHTNVTEVLHVLEVSSSFVANKMKYEFMKSTPESLQAKFTLKFTIEVYNDAMKFCPKAT